MKWLQTGLLALIAALLGIQLTKTLRKTPSESPTSSREVDRLWGLVSRFVPEAPPPQSVGQMPTSRRPDPDLVWNGMLEMMEDEDQRQAFLEQQAYLNSNPMDTPEPDEAHHLDMR